MQKGNKIEYSTFISQRVQKLMDLSGLELIGFADFLSVSESHLYAILNGTRDLTEDVAEKIASAFDLKGGQILRPNYKIPKSIKKSELLNKFCDENKDVKSYFIDTRKERKDSYFVENDLYQTTLFDKPIYIWEIKEYCESIGKKYTSKRLSQILKYMVETKKLKSKKKPLKLRSGGYGERIVEVFYK
ncbi:MAG TPA: helix-turn-helix domain-containing protein [Arachidicoccus soli]|nr:helix-turn-helix domain-containing protein [Arachidicoccus soli]